MSDQQSRFMAKRLRQAEEIYLAAADKAVAPHLGEGEVIVARSGGATRPPGGPVAGTYVVVTDRRFFVVGTPFWSNRPKKVRSVHPRTSVRVVDHGRQSGFDYTEFQLGQSPLRLYVKAWFAPQMAAVAAALEDPTEPASDDEA